MLTFEKKNEPYMNIVRGNKAEFKKFNHAVHKNK